MKQVIKTTNIDTIRPVFVQGASENIKRYHQLRKLFDENHEYRLFAEPSAERRDSLTWYTDFEGEIIPFVNLSDSEKEVAKGRLKFQANNLYRAAIKYIKESKTKDGNVNVSDLFQVFDSCLEIPEYNDIYVIRAANGLTNFVIIRWGFTFDDYGSDKGLIERLIPLKVTPIIIKVSFSDGKIAAAQKIFIQYDDYQIDATTDSDGCVYIESMSFFTKFAVGRYDSDTNEKVDTEQFTCDHRSEYPYIIKLPTCDMRFRMIDSSGNIMPNQKIVFDVGSEKIEATTDQNGETILENVLDGFPVEAYQPGIPESRAQFFASSQQDIYLFSGKYKTIDGHALLVDKTGKAITNARLNITLETTQNQYITDAKGHVFLGSLVPGTQMKAFQPEFQDKITNHVIERNKKEYIIVGNSLFVDMKFILVDDKGKPIANADLIISSGGNKIKLKTDSAGNFVVNNVLIGETVTVEQIIGNKSVVSQSFDASSENNENVIIGKRKVVAPPPPPPIAKPTSPVIEQVESCAMNFLVVDKNDEKIENVRLTYSVLDEKNIEFTDANGKLRLSNIKKGATVDVFIKHGKQNFTQKYVARNIEENFVIKLVPRRNCWWWCLLILLLLALLAYYFMTRNDEVIVVDNSHKITIIDGLTKDRIKKAKVKAVFVNKEYNELSNDSGIVVFDSVQGKEIALTVDVGTYKIKKISFIYNINRIIEIYPEASEQNDEDIDEIPKPCGAETESGGFGTTIKVYELGKVSGKFEFYYELYNIPDQINIYKGGVNDLSKNNLLWTTGNPVSGADTVAIDFEGQELITVETIGPTRSTKWVYTVNCPK